MEFEHLHAERRVIRGRQIVARQREIASASGTPLSIALLETFEASLAVFEDNLTRHLRDGGLCAEQLARPISQTVIDYQARSRRVASVMEILREGGYACELTQPILH